MIENATTDLLVSADWLARHHEDPDVLIVDVRPADRYDAGHIPGAVSLDLYPIKILDSDPELVEGWVREVERAFRAVGIDHDRHVVFYEDISGTTAARGVWLMHALSIGSGAMLDGGLAAWDRAGHALSTDRVAPAPSEVTASLDPAGFATAGDVLAASERGDAAIIDTRGDLEWMQGTVPGARHLEWAQHLDADGTMKPLAELRQLYETLDLGERSEAIRSARAAIAPRTPGSSCGCWGTSGSGTTRHRGVSGVAALTCRSRPPGEAAHHANPAPWHNHRNILGVPRVRTGMA